MRPYMGMVSWSTSSIKFGRFEPCRAVMPRSEMARLIDLVKLSGTVVGSRRSTGHNYWHCLGLAGVSGMSQGERIVRKRLDHSTAHPSTAQQLADVEEDLAEGGYKFYGVGFTPEELRKIGQSEESRDRKGRSVTSRVHAATLQLSHSCHTRTYLLAVRILPPRRHVRPHTAPPETQPARRRPPPLFAAKTWPWTIPRCSMDIRETIRKSARQLEAKPDRPRNHPCHVLRYRPYPKRK